VQLLYRCRLTKSFAVGVEGLEPPTSAL
jgi:hypothetical protein